MKRLANGLNIAEYVKFVGTIKHDEMIEHMNNSDIFVMPSWDEAFGVVYLEAMSLRKPVIGTKDEGISDVVTDGINGLLVEKGNTEELKQKICYLLDNPEERIKIGQKGFESVQDLTWENNAKKMIEIYKEVLKRTEKQYK
jgi:glycosyltransferase involved in cell wall biosynthesis